MSDEEKSAAPGKKSDANNGTTINTAAVSTELDEDGIMSLSDLRKEPLTAEQITEMERQIAEEDEHGCFIEEDMDAFKRWSEGVRQRNEDRKYAKLGREVQRIIDSNPKLSRREYWDQVLASNLANKPPGEEVKSSPPIISLTDCLSVELPEPPQIIHGVLYRGGKLVVGGPSKIGKTFIMQDLAVSVANGLSWFGVQCDQGNVLYLNFELSEFTNQKRWQKILKVKDKGVNSEGIDLRQMKGSAADIVDIVDQTIYWAQQSKKQYDLIILDPIYKSYAGRNENDAGEMAEVLNELDRLILELETSVAFAAHFPKGNMSERSSAMDRISGSGVFARDPEAIITITPWTKQAEDAFRCDVDFTLRDFEQVPQIVIKRDFPIYRVDDNPPNKGGEKTVEDILFILECSSCTSTEWAEKSEEHAGVNRTLFYKLSKEAEQRGLAEKDGRKGRWTITEAGKKLLNERVAKRKSAVLSSIVK